MEEGGREGVACRQRGNGGERGGHHLFRELLVPGEEESNAAFADRPLPGCLRTEAHKTSPAG